MTKRKSSAVREERSGWRDESISKRHREWGFNCPGVDLDFLMVEYNHGLPIAVVEYKHWKARSVNMKHPTYQALRRLCDNYRSDDVDGLAFLIARYWPESWSFRIRPANSIATRWFCENEPMTEQQFVMRLYKMRDLACRESTKRHLKDKMPPDAENKKQQSLPNFTFDQLTLFE